MPSQNSLMPPPVPEAWIKGGLILTLSAAALTKGTTVEEPIIET